MHRVGIGALLYSGFLKGVFRIVDVTAPADSTSLHCAPEVMVQLHFPPDNLQAPCMSSFGVTQFLWVGMVHLQGIEMDGPTWPHNASRHQHCGCLGWQSTFGL